MTTRFPYQCGQLLRAPSGIVSVQDTNERLHNVRKHDVLLLLNFIEVTNITKHECFQAEFLFKGMICTVIGTALWWEAWWEVA